MLIKENLLELSRSSLLSKHNHIICPCLLHKFTSQQRSFNHKVIMKGLLRGQKPQMRKKICDLTADLQLRPTAYEPQLCEASSWKNTHLCKYQNHASAVVHLTEQSTFPQLHQTVAKVMIKVYKSLSSPTRLITQFA